MVLCGVGAQALHLVVVRAPLGWLDTLHLTDVGADRRRRAGAALSGLIRTALASAFRGLLRFG